SPGPMRASENSRTMPLPLPLPCTTIGPASKSPPTLTIELSLSFAASAPRAMTMPLSRNVIRRCRCAKAVVANGHQRLASAAGASANARNTASVHDRATAPLENAQQPDIRNPSGFALAVRTHPPDHERTHDER